MTKAKVRVVSETSTGLNSRVSINGKIHTNTQAYNRAVKGNVEGYHGVNRNGTKFIRSNPDTSIKTILNNCSLVIQGFYLLNIS